MPDTILIPERRVVVADGLHVEDRAGGDGRINRIVGHASVFDRWTTLYESPAYLWREVVRPGAYARAIRELQDVRSLWNHDANFVLGRTLSGTLSLVEDGTGLLTDTEPPDTQTIRDLVLTPIRRGDVSGMSFAFIPRPGPERVERAEGKTVITTPGDRRTIRVEGVRTVEERELLDLDLLDVSPVTYPAYEQTDVALRARGEHREIVLRAQRSGRVARSRSRLAEAFLHLELS